MGPEADVPAVIFQLATKSHVDTVFVDGCPILEQGRSNRVDEGKLLQDIKQKYQFKGDSSESRKLRQAITDQVIRLYSAW